MNPTENEPSTPSDISGGEAVVQEKLPKKPAQKLSTGDRLMLWGAWLIAISVTLTAAYLGLQESATAQAAPPLAVPTPTPVVPLIGEASTAPAGLPDFAFDDTLQAIARQASLHTNIPTRPRQEISEYTVVSGDSIFGIAQNFNIRPDTVLWANKSQLDDNPHMLRIGMSLTIPPVDGIYYEWQEGDSLDSVAQEFKAKVESILNWAGNKLDLANPVIEAGTWVMVPGGSREFQQWIVPVAPSGRAGVVKNVYGAGGCDATVGAYGTGGFIWPTASHVLSGNDYWSGHLAIDIAGGVGDSVYAADGGTVVFAGWSSKGYGYMVMIDHGNGYHTLYAHLSAFTVACGNIVGQGRYIGAVGSTGNSTGPHLHFEVRLNGGFVNPWYVLPPP